MTLSNIRPQVIDHLCRIYPELPMPEIETLTTRAMRAAGCPAAPPPVQPSALPGSGEVMLITYGDTIVEGDDPHLQTLARFWDAHLAEVFSTVHVLPFFPSSSDGGFAVMDYRRIDEPLGDWHDLAALVKGGDLMVDLVCNHGSAQSEWFSQFIADEEPGRGYFLTVDPEADMRSVVRPRTHDLLLPVDTAAGPKHVWATFSHDQVDFDFTNPEVLLEFCSILGFYLSQGATRVRLDAIAYLWKQIGTPCIHLPQTHDVVRLMRTLMQARDPRLLLITETNVPHRQNISYFGDGDEAQVVYNFTLAPLIVWSLITGNGEPLTNWLGQLQPPPHGCTFLNFLASHDGIGVRPVEDLIPLEQLSPLVHAVTQVGGDYSAYSAPVGPIPYEVNVSLADLLAGPEGETAQRYLVAHALMLAVQGIPAIYIHSVLSSPGDIDAARASGHKRDINRPQVDLETATERITSGWRGEVFRALSALIGARRSNPAFAPESAQTVHVLHPAVVALERQADSGERVIALHNMSGEPALSPLPAGCGAYDLISGRRIPVESGTVELGPWAAVWLTDPPA